MRETGFTHTRPTDVYSQTHTHTHTHTLTLSHVNIYHLSVARALSLSHTHKHIRTRTSTLVRERAQAHWWSSPCKGILLKSESSLYSPCKGNSTSVLVRVAAQGNAQVFFVPPPKQGEPKKKIQRQVNTHTYTHTYTNTHTYTCQSKS